ncbi:hypothetical protein CC1G_04352 [Coprinopsis cinerea okayama7|uniref:Protein-lysine N-methyltransferase EFM5 n=1 Tax=Coprinopsis cinerea (strain Okayama-7 / 130 / ATCC MYA-4618 / FGSC 9003) TaxID=240176 RepID=A8N0P9_COPC7|nr:hypothetical protein CC1G_04352 [Coprinopsis cinerea okayama7\|eukprot:XP_001828381.1 hypothetical protein CC1G_04352 [Coprinopsis cinerea okayama7\
MAIGKRGPASDACSDCSDSPVELSADTKALLDLFLANKAEEERRFAVLEEAAQLRKMEVDVPLTVEELQELKDTPMVSVAEFKSTFGEDWQLSQFWYSEDYAYRLAKALHDQCTPETKIAFLCCPTAYVAFQHTKPLPNARLFEYDQRFAVLSPKQFVFYDLDDPEDIPEIYKGHFDFIIADPPFLNETTNRKLLRTLKTIVNPKGCKILLHTSTEMENNGTLAKVYTEPPFGPLKRTAFEPEHGQLANDFASWGNWEGAETFGKDYGDGA